METILLKCPNCQMESIMYVPYDEYERTTDKLCIKQRYSLDSKCNCKILNEEVLKEFNKLPFSYTKPRFN